MPRRRRNRMRVALILTSMALLASSCGRTLAIYNVAALSDGAPSNRRDRQRSCGDGGQVGPAGQCAATSSAGWTNCSGACVDVTSTSQHCGVCCVACATGQVCSNSACTAQCAAGQTACGQACVDLKSNVLSCGGCGIACKGGTFCNNGVCDCGKN